METRYFLGKNFLADNDEDLNYFENEIETQGFCSPIELGYRVYLKRLATLLIAEDLSVEVDEMGERKIVIIQGDDFADAYRTGYDQGKAWFKEDYPKTLLANNAKSYIADLHNLCYHMPLGGYTDGLAGYKDIWANPITHKCRAFL